MESVLRTTNIILNVVSKQDGDSEVKSKGGNEDSTKVCSSGYEMAKDGSNVCLKKYDSCPAGSANPDEGCTLLRCRVDHQSYLLCPTSMI